MASEDLGMMEFDHRERINNVDIMSLVQLLDTAIRQFSRSTSATRYETHKADVTIAENWLSKFEKDFNLYNDEPELFMQKASPKPKPVPLPPTDVQIVQNNFLQHMIYQCSSLRTELLYAESAERLNGFQKPFADTTVKPWIEKQKKTIENAKDDLTNPGQTWFEEADLQEPGINPGEPR